MNEHKSFLVICSTLKEITKTTSKKEKYRKKTPLWWKCHYSILEESEMTVTNEVLRQKYMWPRDFKGLRGKIHKIVMDIIIHAAI